MDKFKAALITLLDSIDEKESEENVKNHLSTFLKDSFFAPTFHINTKGKTDLVVHTGDTAKSPVGILLEVKRPANKADMVSRQSLNAKAMHELILYYLNERFVLKNNDIRHLCITNIYEWYIFNAVDFERLFAKNSLLIKEYESWRAKEKVSVNTDLFYKEIASPFLAGLTEEVPYVYFDLRDLGTPLENEAQENDVSLIPLFKILSPTHLLKLSFANDSNSLDKGFYTELLHIMGLEEVLDNNMLLIRRKAPERRHNASLLENTISRLEREDFLKEIPTASDFGTTKEEKLFGVGLELCLTWINRILFLKLLEAQLLKYHQGDSRFKFLTHNILPGYDEVYDLFFEVLALKPENRTAEISQKFKHIPYLNSSLFDISDLERQSLRINSLRDREKLPLHSGTVLKNKTGKAIADSMPTLEYLFDFLDAYDFASEGGEEIQEEGKTLINASVRGLIFEKINGYKDGSIYTPGFITMYMSHDVIHAAVLRKFNESRGLNYDNIADLKNYFTARYKTTEVLEDNALFNTIRICDPAVGSGHFLVSVLNELLGLKAELGILADDKGERLRGYLFSIENDELIISEDYNFEIVRYFKVKGLVGKRPQQLQKTLFHEKQKLIENCLFGVDINPNSVKICRLRLWIELLKHAYYTEESRFQALETLPNIDINIKCGNSLLSRFTLDSDLKHALRSIKYSVDEYRGFVQDYKNAHNKEEKRGLETIINQIKKDFRTEIYKTDPRIARLSRLSGELLNLLNPKLFDATAKQKAEDARQAKKLEAEVARLQAEIDEINSNATYRQAFEWRFEFPEVLDSEGNFLGFDVIIGNPPYIRQEELSQIKDYLKSHYQVYAGTADILVYFIEKGLELLKSGGEFSFIVSNKFMRAGFGKPLRTFLEQYKIRQVIDFGDLQVFKEATAYPAILSLQKAEPAESFLALNVHELEIKAFPEYVSKHAHHAPHHSLEQAGWNLSPCSDQLLLKKLKSLGKPLKEYIGGKMYRGVLTGLNAAFVINEETRAQLISQDPKSVEVIKPFLAGKDIKRYQVPKSANYLILFKNGDTQKNFGKLQEKDAWEKLTQKYPAICKHLAPFADNAKKRQDKGKYWWELRACDYYKEFEKPKILYQEIAMYQAFTIDKNFHYTNNKLFLIPGEQYSLLGFLNSKLVWFYLWNTTTRLRGDALAMQSPYVLSIPTHESVLQNKKIEKLVIKILNLKEKDPSADTLALEAEIDKLVYELYGLTTEELALVEAK